VERDAAAGADVERDDDADEDRDGNVGMRQLNRPVTLEKQRVARPCP
jgi:hypothetical protein